MKLLDCTSSCVLFQSIPDIIHYFFCSQQKRKLIAVKCHSFPFLSWNFAIWILLFNWFNKLCLNVNCDAHMHPLSKGFNWPNCVSPSLSLLALATRTMPKKKEHIGSTAACSAGVQTSGLDLKTTELHYNWNSSPKLWNEHKLFQL